MQIFEQLMEKGLSPDVGKPVCTAVSFRSYTMPYVLTRLVVFDVVVFDVALTQASGKRARCASSTP